MASSQLETFKGLDGYTLEWVDRDFYILSRRNEIFISEKLMPPFRLIGKVPASLLISNAARWRLIQRLTRFFIYNVIVLRDNCFFVTFQKEAGILDHGKYTPITGFVRPSRFLRGSCAVDSSGGIYLGEYLPNTERGPMRIYRLAPDSTHVHVVYEFAPSTIRHIHGIFFDPFEKAVWCTTGDLEGECSISRTLDGFKTREVLGQGDETWRAVSLVFTADAIWYGMDAEFKQNYLFRLDRKTLQRTQVAKVDGPVYYSKAIGQHLFFGVTAEGCPSQKQNAAALWYVGPTGSAEEIGRFPKDRFNNYFMPGTLHFPLGPSRENKIDFYCLGLKGIDDKSMRFRF